MTTYTPATSTGREWAAELARAKTKLSVTCFSYDLLSYMHSAELSWAEFLDLAGLFQSL